VNLVAHPTFLVFNLRSERIDAVTKCTSEIVFFQQLVPRQRLIWHHRRSQDQSEGTLQPGSVGYRFSIVSAISPNPGSKLSVTILLVDLFDAFLEIFVWQNFQIVQST